MIKKYCDGCGSAITDANSICGREHITIGDAKLPNVVVTHQWKKTDEALHTCKYCFFDAVNALDDRPARGMLGQVAAGSLLGQAAQSCGRAEAPHAQLERDSASQRAQTARDFGITRTQEFQQARDRLWEEYIGREVSRRASAAIEADRLTALELVVEEIKQEQRDAENAQFARERREAHFKALRLEKERQKAQWDAYIAREDAIDAQMSIFEAGRHKRGLCCRLRLCNKCDALRIF